LVFLSTQTAAVELIERRAARLRRACMTDSRGVRSQSDEARVPVTKQKSLAFGPRVRKWRLGHRYPRRLQLPGGGRICERKVRGSTAQHHRPSSQQRDVRHGL
jgi:hypothetical protein